ncbi:MAG: hypothetical protein M3173_00515 [Chloroflexota bacterium]|nr:hypothetical protein [Chloroflexota bacterium]
MPTLEEPVGQGLGEARRFLENLRATWDFFGAYETTEPLLSLKFSDGRTATVADLPDVAVSLYDYLVAFFDPPYLGSVQASASIARTEPPFELAITCEEDDGHEGPMIVSFPDGTTLVASLDTAVANVRSDRWSAGVTTGLVQQRIEAVVSLAQTTGLTDAMPQDERDVAEALLRALGELARTSDPPRGVVREVSSWLWRKVDLFLDEAVKTGGKAAGAVAVGAVAFALHRHAPDLANQLKELVEITK